MKKSKYMTAERIEWLKTQNGVPRSEVAERFNRRYGTDIPYRTMVWWLSKLGVTAPNTRFRNGHKPWNKGMERDEYRTHFTDAEWEEMTGRVLNAERHRVKVGDVKIIKGAHGVEPWIVVRTGAGLSTYEKMQQLDRFVWEKRIGDIPEDCAIVHLNYNPLDCTLDNLAIIKRKWMFEYAHWMRSEHAEINQTTIIWLTLRDALKARKEE